MYLEIVISYKQSDWLIHNMSNKLLVLIDVKLVIYTNAAPDISVEYNCGSILLPKLPPPKGIKLTHSIKDRMLAIYYLINISSSISIPAFIVFYGDF